ncbi:MAG: ribonucleoside-diphosphate reductase, partial [Actinobacteria bacterium]|nr:ribonucleoside-diphosphate reductase [Actinomycetota bacterium]
QDVQRLLSTFGIFSRIYNTRKAGGADGFTHVRNDGTFAVYESQPMYDLRIAGRSIAAFAQHVGFSLPAKAARLRALIEAHRFYRSRETVRLVERVDDGVELTYNLSEPRNHSYVVDGVIVRNCSEYMHLDNSACNLASINLLSFLDEEKNRFDVEGYRHAVEVVFTAQEILVGNADYPTESIAETSRRFRQLGLGYANLGALLMALGLPYDSDQGRAWAGALTAVLTGHAYATSARTAARMGAFAGYVENEEHMLRVLRMHRDELRHIDDAYVPAELLAAAKADWDDAVAWGEAFGVRNSQASVLAPTGCLVGGSLVATSRGLVRLRSLGDPDGPQWQQLGIRVATHEGDREASHFYVNGAEPVVDVVTTRGYRIKGTTTHRVKVVDETGEWVWRRMADLRAGDRVPLALRQLIGAPQHVPLPPLPEAYWAGEHHARAPREMSVELAELVGYFMGDGSLHSRGLRFCVADTDLDVVDRLTVLGKELFGLEAHVAPRAGYREVAFHSVRLVAWWEACGFAKLEPRAGHTGKGWTCHVPDAVLHANDPAVYAAFVRGLFEADGSAGDGYPSWATTSSEFSHEVQTLLLALGFPTTRRSTTSGRGSSLAVLRLLNISQGRRWTEEIGFLGDRKNRLVWSRTSQQSARYDHIPVTRELVDRLAPANDRLRRVLLQELSRGRVSRRIADELYERTGDAELGHLLGFFYDTIASATLGDEELTYDLSVPDNVTYLANGFVSHNTIGLLMDCDTTGVEPDLGLCKMKKLVGGGTMTIVNQTVPRALRRLGYTAEQVDAIVAYIDENKSILGAPHLAAEHIAVFACSMGDNAIHYNGHLRMMGAVQRWISGAISKTVNMPEDVSVADVEQLHIDAWKLGIKAVAIYRDNCKVAQPLSMAKKEVKPEELAAVLEAAPPQVVERIVEKIVLQPVRQKLPRNRRSRTFEFRVADCKGFVTVGEYDDGRPGELFLRVSKQGSTLAGIMDAFAISVSHGLQYGVPLKAFIEAFTNMRFEPAGMTDDADIRFATSLVDYIFRRLAVDYLPLDERMELGILSVGERHSPTLPGIEEATTETSPGLDLLPAPPAEPTVAVDLDPLATVATVATTTSARPGNRDAPYCMQCGVQMIRAGSCHACPSCGSTSGCS